jgi:hypothetical protein
MVCNQSPPLGDKPSLMTFREVRSVQEAWFVRARGSTVSGPATTLLLSLQNSRRLVIFFVCFRYCGPPEKNAS